MTAASRNIRGSVDDRRRRREWMVKTFGIPNQKGVLTRIACVHCGHIMFSDGSTWQIDRFPRCGHLGGRYIKGNMAPSCPPCNMKRCGNAHVECAAGMEMRRRRVA